MKSVGLFFIVLWWSVLDVRGLSPTCCAQVQGSCRSACEKMSLVAVATNQGERQSALKTLNVYCSRQMDSFWVCINETLQEIDRGSGWSGRPCCHLPQSNTCRRECLQTKNRNELLKGCRQSDEMAFYSCLDRQEAGDQCCSKSETAECRRACKEIFVSSASPSRQVRASVEALCSQSGRRVLDCVQNFTKSTPSSNSRKNIHCCEKSQKEQCRNTCRKILRANSSSQELVIDTLIEGGCGQPVLHDSLWQCFLSNSNANKQENVATSRKGKLGTDSAKLHCCFEAVTPLCQKLCYKTYGDQWESNWKSFHRFCLYRSQENKMQRCLEEVDEPCELGCEELSYCSNFNNRPTEMFRSCNSWSDHGARSEMDVWRSGFINTTTISIPIVNTGKCFPAMWKAIACMLAVKPCASRHSYSRLCRSDCMDSLTKCIDYKRLPNGLTPDSICDTLLPGGQDMPCTPLANYLVPSPNEHSRTQITFPCRPNPCNVTDKCIVNRECVTGQKCLHYKCVPGCRMGETSHMIVPEKSLVHIPISGNNSGCLKVCQCSDHNTFDECNDLPCLSTEGCTIGGKLIYAHKSTFQLDCNTCACFAGEVTCSNQACHRIKNIEVPGLTGLPCNCPNHYVPVCGSNGKTYPSACVAACFGLPDEKMEFGSCSDIDPCQPNPCKNGQRCLQMRKVCLSSVTLCPQYTCVDSDFECLIDKRNPACDLSHNNHPTLCSLLQKDRVLAYMGPCLTNCRNVGPVCGQNGETYATECNAWADRVLVDYQGPCVAIGLNMNGIALGCNEANCPSLPVDRCHRVTPPGACCAICGSAIKLLYSQRQAERVELALRDSSVLTVEDVVNELRQHIKVLQCDAFGYLSVEGEIALVVTSTARRPTALQMETCAKEARKLEQMIQLGSPVFLNNFLLSIVMAASVVNDTSGAVSLALRTAWLPTLTLCLAQLLLLASRRILFRVN